uniref:Uncharacterized protein n=1 Tax=Megaviridae environmental sample TaxID=1737588 RepID=A0A5J6VHG4_9VIRU|nr:MAG: hypothetical protein [Megaviridae environmental sample]
MDISYTYQDQMNTGDVLLFHTNSWWDYISWVIDLFSWSKYSHAAMIIKNPPWDENLKGLYVIQSTVGEIHDIQDNEIKIGVQLERFQDVMKYNGTVYWRKLNINRDKDFNNAVIAAESIAHNRPYDFLPVDWIKTCFDLHSPISNEQRKKTFFCSALVSFMLVSMGVLPKDTAWSTIRPKDLGTEKGSRLSIQELHTELAIEELP